MVLFAWLIVGALVLWFLVYMNVCSCVCMYLDRGLWGVLVCLCRFNFMLCVDCYVMYDSWCVDEAHWGFEALQKHFVSLNLPQRNHSIRHCGHL